ncbi:MAG: glycosyltransferase family 39 protein [Candidatus Levybacteria bacterium]|nr:glycosyltransferase family 39 protein [Candidatus Levybacteria bacterium]
MILRKIKNKSLFILIFLFFLSRIFFITTDPVMFDSSEYARRLSENNLFTAIVSGHIPYHAGYILLFWPIFNFAKFINFSSLYLVLFSQVILATFSIYFFYKSVKILFDEKTALFSTIFASLFPLYWIANLTVMIETTYVSFFIFSLYFLLLYLKKKKIFFLLLSSFFFGFSFFIQFSVILWLPFLIALCYFLNKKIVYKVSLYFLISLSLFGSISVYLLAYSSSISFANAFLVSYFSHQGDIPKDFSIYDFFVYLRNFIIPLLRNNTNLIVILGFISIFKLFFSNKKYFWLLFLLVLPSIILNQAWDSLFFGRHSVITGFGLAILTSLLINKNIKYAFLIILYLIFTTFPQLPLLKNVPYLVEANFVKNLPKGLLIISHFEKPYIKESYNGEVLSTIEGGLEEKLNEYLKNRKKIFITSSAVSDPYGLYSGPYLHSLSLSYKHSYLLKPLLTKYLVYEYKKISEEDNLIIYSIAKKEKSSYPAVKNMRASRRRIDFFDPITQIWLYLDKKFKILHSP